MFAAIHARLERISQYAVWAGGTALLAAALMVTVDVLCRKLFNVTMSGDICKKMGSAWYIIDA